MCTCHGLIADITIKGVADITLKETGLYHPKTLVGLCHFERDWFYSKRD